MGAKANKRKTLLSSNIQNEVNVQSKKQKLLNCSGIAKVNSFIKFCTNNTAIHNDKTKMTFSADKSEQLLIYNVLKHY